MNRKEPFFISPAGELLYVAAVSTVIGLCLMAAAGDLYRTNIANAAVLQDTAANVYRVDVTCPEATP